MKQSALLILLLTALSANATDNSRDEHNPNTNAIAGANAAANAAANALAGATALSGSTSYSGIGSVNAGSTTANNSVSVDNGGERIPVSSAIAPNITQNAICPIITGNSHAVQFLFFGGSTSGGQSLNPLCLAYHQGDKELVNQIACNTSSDYKKALKQLGRECKD